VHGDQAAYSRTSAPVGRDRTDGDEFVESALSCSWGQATRAHAFTGPEGVTELGRRNAVRNQPGSVVANST